MERIDRRVLVTGGSLGIGKAIARALVARGARVAITGRDDRRLERAAAETGAFPVRADVGRPDDVERTYETVLAEFGSLDCLVNNAGIALRRPVDEVTVEDLERVFRVNVFGPALMTARAAALFKSAGGGDIVNIGSTAALKGYEGGTVYAASKFALRGMTLCWQAELRRHGIRVFLVNPSEVATAIGSPERVERTPEPNKLSSGEIAHAVVSILTMARRGFVPELSVWATNPW